MTREPQPLGLSGKVAEVVRSTSSKMRNKRIQNIIPCTDINLRISKVNSRRGRFLDGSNTFQNQYKTVQGGIYFLVIAGPIMARNHY